MFRWPCCQYICGPYCISETMWPRMYANILLDAILINPIKALGLPTSAALPVQLPTIQAALVSARPSLAIRLFHKPEQLGLEGGASSSQLQLSATHCHFTFGPRPSVTVSLEQGSRLIFSGCSLSLIFPLRTNYWRDWTELKKTVTADSCHPRWRTNRVNVTNN